MIDLTIIVYNNKCFSSELDSLGSAALYRLSVVSFVSVLEEEKIQCIMIGEIFLSPNI